MVALCFREIAVDAKQPQFVQNCPGLFSRFTPNRITQSLARLHAPAWQVPAVRVGVFDEKNPAVLHGKQTDPNGQRS